MKWFNSTIEWISSSTSIIVSAIRNIINSISTSLSNGLGSVDSKVNPEFGAKAHKVSRTLSRFMLFVVIPVTLLSLIAVGGATHGIDGLGNIWAPFIPFVKVAVATLATMISITIASHLSWLYFSKWEYKNVEDNKLNIFRKGNK